MSNPIQRLFRAMAQRAASEIECGEFLPSGRQAHLLYGGMYSDMERKGTDATGRRKPEVTHVSVTRCESSLRSRRRAPTAAG